MGGKYSTTTVTVFCFARISRQLGNFFLNYLNRSEVFLCPFEFIKKQASIAHRDAGSDGDMTLPLSRVSFNLRFGDECVFKLGLQGDVESIPN